ncbi:glyoxysomal processing protease, glyoxysomal isoform X1 [Actinidia eriantha]|uniref:glyoxysomal processing protease, glyoxysomal isoform X1 n=1 Tax=Actinidia eriantha TaxID=165200 RepID=UPI0025827D4C|nr:glyoxysomal processing protease, glyoxysomal isoform X1 [Actinidia eriantha]
MGLPEIVDFARNFAAMVRVQGPDPKGLKMRNHAFHLYNSGKTTLSASGILLPGSSALVVTVASIVEPFLSLQHRENMSQHKPELIPGAQIDIVVEGKKWVENEAKSSDERVPHWLSARLLALVEVPVTSSAIQSLIEASSASLEHGWEVGWSLASYNDGPQPLADARQSQTQMAGGESSNPNLMSRSTAKIALLGVCSTISEDLPNLNISPSNKRGNLLLAMGSPFGVLSPIHFFNSISLGSVANCYPSGSAKRSLLMADIRCLPGMEGGPVFGEHGLLIGVLTRPLKQRISGAEIQLVIPWEAIATACSDLLQEEPQNAFKRINYNNGNLNAVGRLCLSNSLDINGSSNHPHEHVNSACPSPSLVEKAMASICLVTINNRVWASGILLNDKGLILTNAHLLEPWRFRKATAHGERNPSQSEVLLTASNPFPSGHEGIGGDQSFQGLQPRRLKTTDSSVVDNREARKLNWTKTNRSISVRLDHTDPWIWCDARVVYVSKGPLDVALLQLEFVPDQLCPIVMDFTCPSPGLKVFVIGHGLFGPRCDFSPSACVGVVAKVVEAKRPLPYWTSQQENACGHFPAMLETTAAVHPGGSGGAVVNSDGHMVGLVTSNARHGGGTVIPHLNFSIPCAALEPIFMFSKDMKDLSLLEGLDKPNEHLSSVWALVPPLSPKPGPPLPYLPEPLPGDINTYGKGSRFAKFMAERQEVLKKSNQLGRTERLSKDFTPSKL